MSYTVSITVTDCQTGKPLQGVVITDGQSTPVKTGKNGQVNFEVTSPENAPDENVADTVQISLDKYTPESATLSPDGPFETAICLQPYPEPPSPSPPLQIPGAPRLTPQPATITTDNSILVSWTSPQSYDKYLIWWTYEGAPQGVSFPQGEVDNTGSTGSWTASPTTSGYTYTFKVEGGNKNLWGILGYHYSGWGPTASVPAVPNFTSLRAFLQASGVSLPQRMRSLMSSQASLRTFMKLA